MTTDEGGSENRKMVFVGSSEDFRGADSKVFVGFVWNLGIFLVSTHYILCRSRKKKAYDGFLKKSV